MNWDTLFDPLFRVPFAAGLLMAVVLPIVGVLLRLRDEWLAALGLAHLAGASGLLGLAVGIPAVFGALAGALVGGLLKSFGRFRGNTIYALMILVGWAATLLVANNTALGSAMGHALVEGQLYFVGHSQLFAVLIYFGATVTLLPRMIPALMRLRLFPGLVSAKDRSANWQLGFDLLAALGMAVGTGTFGLMAAFALVFVPPWIAFKLAPHWQACLIISSALGTLAYLLAFVTALTWDQPFAPILVATLLVIAVLTLISRSQFRRH